MKVGFGVVVVVGEECWIVGKKELEEAEEASL